MPAEPRRLADELETGLSSPICLTWELTYGCNLQCRHCLSSSGRRDPRELTTEESRRFIDDLAEMKVFYVNIGGGEPTLRRDFLEIVEYAVTARVGVKFSTNGTTMTAKLAQRLAALDYVDVQVSLDGADAAVNDAVRGAGSHEAAMLAMAALSEAGFGPFKLSVVLTRHNVSQLEALLELARRFGAVLRLTRLRPSGRGMESWAELHPTRGQLSSVHGFLVAHPEVLTGDSFFHLGPLGEDPLAGLNFCGAGKVVCLVDPVGDVYACPFVMHPDFRAGTIRDPGGFPALWRTSELFSRLRSPSRGGTCRACGAFSSCHGGCMAAKFFTGLALDGPDPECVLGHGEASLARGQRAVPVAMAGHGRRGPARPVRIGRALAERP